MVLSSSPTSVDEAIRHVNAKVDSRFGSAPIDLADFVDALPPILRHQKEHAQKSLHARATHDELRGTADDPVSELFGRLDLGLGEWRKYALFDSSKHYTRRTGVGLKRSSHASIRLFVPPPPLLVATAAGLVCAKAKSKNRAMRSIARRTSWK
jgi:hypothetical protein